MKFINGTNRNQLPLFASSIDDAIVQDNEIRLIDLFVDSINLPDFGFTFDFVENGRPAYHPSDLLKLFIYGHLNRMRSSRTLEKECCPNKIEHHIAYIDTKLEGYSSALAKEDGDVLEKKILQKR